MNANNNRINPDLVNLLPADLIYTIMQYACYKTHPTAKMIKDAYWDGSAMVKDIDGDTYPIFDAEYAGSNPTDYIEVDCAEMFKEVEQYDLAPSDWFYTLTEQYADISEEWRENLVDYRKMIMEAEDGYGDWDGDAELDYRIAGSRAWGLYKIVSNCPTMVH